MRKSKMGSMAVMMATMAMAMDPSMFGGGITTRVREKPKKECPNCHTMHDGKHLSCSGSCYKTLVEKQRNARQ